MGRSKVIIRLLVACLVCGAVLWWLQRPVMRTVSRRGNSGKLFRSSLREVNYVMLEQHDGSQIEFRREASGWTISTPSFARALDSAVKKLLDDFEQAPLYEYIDREDISLRELSPADFGFAHPFGRMVIRGPRIHAEIKAGDCDAVTNGFFVSVIRHDIVHDNAFDGVYVTDPALRAYFSKTTIDFMDRCVLHTDMRQVTSVVLRRPSHGDIKLVREGKHQWVITQPFEARADWDAVARLFEVLASAEVVDFEGGILPKNVDFGFDSPDAPSVRLFSDDDPVGQTLVFGFDIPGADLRYARNPEIIGEVVTGSVYRAVMEDVYSFCDRRVFPSAAPVNLNTISVTAGEKSFSMRRAEDNGWDVTSPVTENADPEIAARLTDAILSLTASRLMPRDESIETNRVASVSVSTGSKGSRFDVFNTGVDTEGSPVLSVVPEKSSIMYVVPDAAVSNIVQYCANPLPLVSRTLFSISENNVRAITVTRAGEPEERIERSAEKWISPAALREVDTKAVARIFAAVAPLKGDGVISLSPSDEYPTTGGGEIAFDMADGTSIRRILKIGPRTETGHYATVKGRDAVFLISNEVASTLLGHVLLPDAAPAENGAADSAFPNSNRKLSQ